MEATEVEANAANLSTSGIEVEKYHLNDRSEKKYNSVYTIK